MRAAGMTADALAAAAQMADLKRIQDERRALVDIPPGFVAGVVPELRRLAEQVERLEAVAEQQQLLRAAGFNPALLSELPKMEPVLRQWEEEQAWLHSAEQVATIHEGQRRHYLELEVDAERERIRVREEHEASKRNAASTAPASPPQDPQPALHSRPVREATAKRNERWLLVFDDEVRTNSKGAQARAIRRIVKEEPVTDATAKRGIQDAEKVRAARYRGLDPGKKRPAHPFDMVKPPKRGAR